MRSNLKSKVKVGDVISTNKKGRQHLGVEKVKVLQIETNNPDGTVADYLPTFTVETSSGSHNVSHRFFDAICEYPTMKRITLSGKFKSTYYTLYIDWDKDGNFSPEFGDWDKEVVLQERKDDFDGETWKIVETIEEVK